MMGTCHKAQITPERTAVAVNEERLANSGTRNPRQPISSPSVVAVAECLVTGLAPLPTKAADRATEILAGEQGPYGGAPHQSGGVGSARGIGACGFDNEEIEQGADGPRDEQVHENRAAVGGQIH